MKRMKSYTRILAPLAVLGGLCAAAPASAQVYSYYPPSGYGDRPVQWFVDGGYSVTSGQTNTYFNNGWTVGGGVVINPDPHGPFAMRVDLDYGYYSATNAFLNGAGLPVNSGYMDTFTGSFDGVLRAPISGYARFYAMAGVGLGWQGIYIGQGGYCYCGYYASSSSTNFTWNAGLGIDFMLPYGQAWFIEARYERMETSGAPTEFIPIRFGWRF